MTSIPNDDGAVRAIRDASRSVACVAAVTYAQAGAILSAIREGKVPGVTTHSITTLHEYIASEDKLRADLAALREALAAVGKERDEALECLLLTKGELEAIKNDPQSNQGTNVCGHNRYWLTHYGRCMACERDQADKSAAEAIAARDALSASQGVMVGVLREAQESILHSEGCMARMTYTRAPLCTCGADDLNARITALLPPEAL